MSTFKLLKIWIQANYKKDGTNSLSIQPKVLSDVVQNFQQNLLEITLEVLQEKVLVRNYIDESSSKSIVLPSFHCSSYST